jgi:hypothetical protein
MWPGQPGAWAFPVSCWAAKYPGCGFATFWLRLNTKICKTGLLCKLYFTKPQIYFPSFDFFFFRLFFDRLIYKGVAGPCGCPAHKLLKAKASDTIKDVNTTI